jgi:hypothetical protein
MMAVKTRTLSSKSIFLIDYFLMVRAADFWRSASAGYFSGVLKQMILKSS